jgi:hypothetical protein
MGHKCLLWLKRPTDEGHVHLARQLVLKVSLCTLPSTSPDVGWLHSTVLLEREA